MSQPKSNKPLAYSRAYGSGPRSSSRLHRPIRPLFWEQEAKEKEEEDIRMIEYMRKHYGSGR